VGERSRRDGRTTEMQTTEMQLDGSGLSAMIGEVQGGRVALSTMAVLAVTPRGRTAFSWDAWSADHLVVDESLAERRMRGAPHAVSQ